MSLLHAELEHLLSTFRTPTFGVTTEVWKGRKVGSIQLVFPNCSTYRGNIANWLDETTQRQTRHIEWTTCPPEALQQGTAEVWNGYNRQYTTHTVRLLVPLVLHAVIRTPLPGKKKKEEEEAPNIFCQQDCAYLQPSNNLLRLVGPVFAAKSAPKSQRSKSNVR